MILNKFYEINPILIAQIQYCHFQKRTSGSGSPGGSNPGFDQRSLGGNVSNLADSFHSKCREVDKNISNALYGDQE